MSQMTMERVARSAAAEPRGAGGPVGAVSRSQRRALRERRYAITPQMRDYDALERKSWVPYLMVFHPPRLKTSAFTTDASGFRRTVWRGQPLSWELYNAPTHRRAALIGASAAFGIGASSDAGTLASLLNERQERRWWNFAGRGFNSTQELLIFLLHLPQDVERILIFSGANNLVLSYLAGATSPVFNSFYAQSTFERGLRSGLVTGVRGSVNLLLREVARKLAPPVRATRTEDGAERYEHVMACFRRDLRLWSLLGEALGCPVQFLLQPMAVWIDKALTPEEEELFSILDRCDPSDYWAGLSDYLRRQQARYVGDVRRLCGEFRIPFADLNQCPLLAEPRWLFVDRAHLTDGGYAQVAEEIRKEFPG